MFTNITTSELTEAPETSTSKIFGNTTAEAITTTDPTHPSYTFTYDMAGNHSETSTMSCLATLTTDTRANFLDASSDFWIILAFTFIISILAIVGNGLVIYASILNKSSGPFRYIDDIIKSLGVSDLLLGFLGNPCIVLSYFMG